MGGGLVCYYIPVFQQVINTLVIIENYFQLEVSVGIMKNNFFFVGEEVIVIIYMMIHDFQHISTS